MIRLLGLHKSFGEVVAVRDFTLEVKRGEFLCLLGPSGCGKSTLLRMIAGFVPPDRGSIEIGGQDVSGWGPDARPTAMVFQDYAIFPHLSVYKNLEFGLKAQRVDKQERIERIRWVLELVGMEEYGPRNPSELSGGQQQRVAVARALAIQPDVLLMDEPLSNLDAKTRVMFRTELRRLQREVGTTILYVTHDQEEALALGDRIAVMKEGALEQVGTGPEVYSQPGSRYVADFIGLTNWIRTELRERRDDNLLVATSRTSFLAVPSSTLPAPLPNGSNLEIALRPEQIIIQEPGTKNSKETIRGKVVDEQFLGPLVRSVIDIGGTHLIVHTASGGWGFDQEVQVSFDAKHALAFPIDTREEERQPASMGVSQSTTQDAGGEQPGTAAKR